MHARLGEIPVMPERELTEQVEALLRAYPKFDPGLFARRIPAIQQHIEEIIAYVPDVWTCNCVVLAIYFSCALALLRHAGNAINGLTGLAGPVRAL